MLRGLIEAYLEAKRLENVSRGSLALYRRNLEMWLRWREGQQLEADLNALAMAPEIRQYLAYLKDTRTPHAGRQPGRRSGLAPASQAAAYRILRAFWRWGVAEGHLRDDSVFRRVKAPRVPQTIRREANQELLQRLLAACGDPLAGGRDGELAARDRALLWMLYESGARISEVLSLRDSDLDLERRRASIVGKGGRRRPIFWRASASAALMQYLMLRRGPRGGAVPVWRGVSHRNNGGQLTPDAFRSHLKRVAAESNITLPPGQPLHCFRHGFARRAIRNRADISQVSQLLGHRSIATTMLYLRSEEDALAEMYQDIFEPARTDETRPAAMPKSRKSESSEHG